MMMQTIGPYRRNRKDSSALSYLVRMLVRIPNELLKELALSKWGNFSLLKNETQSVDSCVINICCHNYRWAVYRADTIIGDARFEAYTAICP